MTIIIGLLFLLAPIFAMAQSTTGSIQGFNCVTQGKVCPIGKEDPVAATENVFVLLVDAAKADYYFLPNVDRAVLARRLNTQVTIEGAVDSKWKSIKVASISSGGKVVWSTGLQEEMNREIGGYK